MCSGYLLLQAKMCAACVHVAVMTQDIYTCMLQPRSSRATYIYACILQPGSSRATYIAGVFQRLPDWKLLLV